MQAGVHINSGRRAAITLEIAGVAGLRRAF